MFHELPIEAKPMSRKRTNGLGLGLGLGRLPGVAVLIWLLMGTGGLRGAAIQFDVFLGYGSQPTGMDGLVREAGWFLVGCELHNSGPSFDAVVELIPDQFGRGQVRRFAIELPTNTRKRFAIPVFASAGYYSTWEARLLDERGRVRAEWTGLRPRAVAWETLVMGSIPRTFGGLPRFPSLPDAGNRSMQQPTSVRMLTELMPEDAIALEGLDALYLNSEKALELRAPQAEALTSWVLGGGHLIVAVEDPAEVNSQGWLRDLLPGRLGEVRTVRPNEALTDWGRPLVDPATLEGGARPIRTRLGQARGFPKYRAAWLFGGRPEPETGEWGSDGVEDVAFPVTISDAPGGEVLLAVDGMPLIIRDRRGMGQVTLLTFSPEREPFRSWANRDWFWARLLGIPALWYDVGSGGMYGGQSVDGLFGVMIDSRQVRKLPISWLLVLLVAYLVVIGPLDRYVLRRARREMLTWVTFPAYVVMFSLLIYYIGYRLRAGDTEWNELHVVDVVQRAEASQWRGRTYASIYSPVPARYRLASDLGQATLRGEYLGMVGAGTDTSRIDLAQRGDGFEAELFVPVWTSRLCVSDWVHGGATPIHASWVTEDGAERLRVYNQLPVEIAELWVARGDWVYQGGAIGAGTSRELDLSELNGTPLRLFVRGQAQSFAYATQARHRAFGTDGSQWAEANGSSLTAVSFIGELEELAGPMQRQFLYPAGFDLSSLIGRGDTVVLAWVPDYGPVPTLRRFRAVRIQENTFFRMALPVERRRGGMEP
jgi:hypothetical protein